MITRLEVKVNDIKVIKDCTYTAAYFVFQKVRKANNKKAGDPVFFDELAKYWKCSQESLIRHLDKMGVKN